MSGGLTQQLCINPLSCVCALWLSGSLCVLSRSPALFKLVSELWLWKIRPLESNRHSASRVGERAFEGSSWSGYGGLLPLSASVESFTSCLYSLFLDRIFRGRAPMVSATSVSHHRIASFFKDFSLQKVFHVDMRFPELASCCLEA